MTPEAIEEQLDKANASLIAGHHADSWPRQARLAAAGDWAGLRRYIASTKLRLNRIRPSGRTTCPSTPPVIVAGGVPFRRCLDRADVRRAGE